MSREEARKAYLRGDWIGDEPNYVGPNRPRWSDAQMERCRILLEAMK